MNSFESQNFQFNFAEFHLPLKGPLISRMYYFSIWADRSNKVFNFEKDSSPLHSVFTQDYYRVVSGDLITPRNAQSWQHLLTDSPQTITGTRDIWRDERMREALSISNPGNLWASLDSLVCELSCLRNPATPLLCNVILVLSHLIQ